MDETTSVIVVAAVVFLIVILALVSLIISSDAQNKIIEESDCNQLSQLIKDRGNDRPPRYDKTLSKWVALECWK